MTARPDGRRIGICFVIGTLDRGGTEGQLVRLATGLDRTRFDPAVCCLFEDGPHRHALEDAGVSVEIIGLRRRSGFGAPLALPRRLFRLVSFIRASRPEIVHGFLFWAYVLGAFAARANHVPVVVASRRSLGFFKTSRPAWRLIERLANRLTDHFVANSEAVRQDVLREERLPPDKVSVIYNGLDLLGEEDARSTALRATLGVSPCGPVIAVVANFHGYKGYEFFFDALEMIVRACPATVALLVGDGPMRGHFEEHARARGLTSSVRFLGARSDVPAVLAIADVVVHPSTQEGFSNAILEAMAVGKPVVAASVGGNPEAVVDRETGLLVPPCDGAALADATIWLLRRPEEARAMGHAGRQRVERRFGVERMLREYERLYEQLVARSAGGLFQPAG